MWAGCGGVCWVLYIWGKMVGMEVGTELEWSRVGWVNRLFGVSVTSGCAPFRVLCCAIISKILERNGSVGGGGKRKEENVWANQVTSGESLNRGREADDQPSGQGSRCV